MDLQSVWLLVYCELPFSSVVAISYDVDDLFVVSFLLLSFFRLRRLTLPSILLLSFPWSLSLSLSLQLSFSLSTFSKQLNWRQSVGSSSLLDFFVVKCGGTYHLCQAKMILFADLSFSRRVLVLVEHEFVGTVCSVVVGWVMVALAVISVMMLLMLMLMMLLLMLLLLVIVLVLLLMVEYFLRW